MIVTGTDTCVACGGDGQGGNTMVIGVIGTGVTVSIISKRGDAGDTAGAARGGGAGAGTGIRAGSGAGNGVGGAGAGENIIPGNGAGIGAAGAQGAGES